MPLFKKSSSGAGSLFDVHRRALHQCRSIFLKDLDLCRVTDYLSLHDNNNHFVVSDHHDNNAGGMATRDAQIAQFLDFLEMGGHRSFGTFLDYLKENQRHLHLVLEETIQDIASFNCNSEVAEGDVERDVVMSGETVRRLLQRKNNKNKSRKGNSKPDGRSESTHNGNTKDDADDNDDGGDGGAHHYIDCYTVATKGRQQTECWMKHDKTRRKDLGQTDEQLVMCVLTSDSLFQRISISSEDWSAIPVGVRIPPKRCNVYIYKKCRGHHVPGSDSKPNSGDKVQQSEMDKRSVGFVGGRGAGHGGARSQMPPPVPPKPNYLPLMGLSSGMARVRKAELDSRSQVVKPATPKRPIRLPEPSIVNCTASETTLSSSNGTAQREVDKTPVANGNQGDVDRRERRTEEREEEEETDCCLDYNVSVCSASDLAFDPGQKEELSCDLYEPIDSPQKEELVPLGPLFCPLPTYSTVDLEKKTSRKAIGGGTEAELKAEDSAEVEPIAVTMKEEETANIAEKSPVDSLPDEAIPVSKESDTKLPQSGKDLRAAPVASDPPLPAKKLPSSVLQDDEDEEEDEDSSGSNSFYEDIDILSRDPLISNASAGVDIYLDPLVRQRTLSQRRKQVARVSDDMESPSCKLVLKGSFLIAEAEDACPNEIQSSETCAQSCESSDVQPTSSGSIHSVVQSDIHSSNFDSNLDGTAMQISTLADESSSKLVARVQSSNHDLLEQFRGTRLAYDKDGHALYVPVDLLKRYGEPDGEAWFYPLELTSRQAALFLRAEKLEGCFVVYRTAFRSAGIAYNLSICLESGDVVHYHVVENVHGDVMIEGHDHAFLTITDLVDYFSHNKASLATRLRRPLRYARFPISPGFHYDSRYELQRAELSLTGNIIGQGNFGVVCAGVYRNQPVAVKVLQQTEGTLTDEDDFLEEAKSLMGLSHEHIVRLIGVSCTARPFFIVTEFASKGSVKECLRNERISLNNLDVLFNISIQMVSAMTYLESLRFLLHRDLASRNFLLADDFCVKLADFGRARFVTDDWFEAPSKERICIKWAAPEVLIDSHYSTKSDVWAMGVVLWEVFSRAERPYAALPGEQTAIYVVEGGRLDRPHGCPPDIYRIMYSCWREDRRDRPTFRELYRKLSNNSSLCSVPMTESFQGQKQSTVSDSNQATTPSKSPTPSAKTKLQLINSNGKKTNKLGSPRDEERRISVEQRLLAYRNRTGTSSSEASVASGNGFLDVDREEDLTRSDRIRLSLRKLMKMTTTKTKGDCKADVAVATRTPSGGRSGHNDSMVYELRP